MPPPADAIELDSRDIYKEFRIRGYDYGQVRLTKNIDSHSV